MKKNYVMIICDLHEKYESYLKDVGEIQGHFYKHIDIAINIDKCSIKIRRETFDIIITVGDKLLRIPPYDYGNIYIY